LGYYASRAGYSFFLPEGAGGTSQEFLRSREISQLRHGHSSQR
jgi:hypothetical protein